MALRRQKHNSRFFFLRSQLAQRKRIWPNDQPFNWTVQAYIPVLTQFEFSGMHWSARRFDPDPGPEGQKLPTKMEKSRNWKIFSGYALVVIFGLHPHTPTINNAVLRIRITLMRIRILLFTLMRVRILLFTLMQIRIRIPLFTLMRIRIQLFTFDADPDPFTHFLQICTLQCSKMTL